MVSSPDSVASLPPDTSRGYQYLAVQWSLVSVATILVIVRFYIRGVIRKKIGGDDYTILAALVCALIQSALAAYQVREGFGRNIQYLQPAQIVETTKAGIVTIVLNIVGTSLVRISVCLFVLQLLPFIERFSRYFIYGLMAFLTLSTVAVSLVVSLECIPIKGVWDRTIHARCLSPAALTKINQGWGVITVIMDILCVLLPMLVFGKLQISWREKLAVFTLLGLGLLTAGAAVARTVSYQFASKNPTWDLVPEGIWACVEQNVGMIVASIPVLRQLFTNFRKRRNTRHSHSSERPFGGGDPLTRSPLYPSLEDIKVEQTPSLHSPVSSFSRKGGTTQKMDDGNKHSPTLSIASRLGATSLSAEKVPGVEVHGNVETGDGSSEWEERRDSQRTLAHQAVLGYSCDIEKGPPKLRT